MDPGDWFAVSVQPGCNAIKVVRPVHVMLNVLFARPHHLHRTSYPLCDLDRANNEIHLKPTAEATTEEVIVNPNLFRWQAG